MSLTENLNTVTSRISLLTERFEAVGQQLADTAREMARGGEVPSAALTDELDGLRAEFVDVRRMMLDLSAAAGVSSPQPNGLSSLAALQSLVQCAAETIQRRAAEQIQQAARAVLEQVLSLSHAEGIAFAPLAEAQASAEQLLTTVAGLEWPTTHAELADLAAGRHPFAYLVELAQPALELDDARWEFLRDAVAAHFGGPLAVAGARGRLTPSQPDPVPDEYATEDEWPTVTLGVGRQPSPVAALSPPLPSEPAPAAARVPPEAAVLEQAVSTLAFPRADPAPPDDTLSHSPHDLIWRALLANRIGAAFQLTTYLDGQNGAPSSPPVWLLRALALSPHLLYVNGDLALQLTEEFAQFDPDQLAAAGGADDARALQLLLAAAALRPALVAPDTGAWTILRALPADPTLEGIRRYAQVISDYGERHPPLSLYTFAPELSSGVWRDTLEDLLRDIGAWRVRLLGMQPSFPPATDVWRCWLRPEGVVHTLLAPLTADPRGLESARGISERLSNEAQIRWEIGHTDRVVLGRSGGPDITTQPAVAGELRRRLREAVAFARRWIALQENRPGRPDDEPRRLAKRLQHQLSELRLGVTQELDAADVPDAPLPLRAAIARCRAAFAGVDALLGSANATASSWWQPVEEPPAGLVLYGELMCVPGVQLDAQWRPVRIDPAQLVRALQRMLLRNGQPDWQDAFAAQLRLHDHLATARVIQAIELDDEARGSSDLARLRLARADDLDRSGEELRREIALTRQAIDSAAAQGRLVDELERTRCLSIVEGIAIAFPGVLQFEPELARLRGIRDELRPVREGASRPSAATAPDARPDGREQQRTQLAAMDGPCLLVAAAGLGTSHLLRKVAEAHHSPDQSRVALVVDMTAKSAVVDDSEPVGERSETERFWHLLAESIRDIGLTETQVAVDADALESIQAWLAADPARQLLVLIDGADALLEEETRQPAHANNLFATSDRLAMCMHECLGRLKFVLAGSLTVLRASRVLEHPLAGRGWIRLGPLLEGKDWQGAHALLSHGLADSKPESPTISARILSLANYEPASILSLARLLAERCRGATITCQILDECTASREAERALTETLHATLAQDPRLSVLVYSLATWYWRRPGAVAEAGVEGVSSAWLREQAVSWWEEGFRNTWSQDTFRDLLDDLLGLGLVGELGPDEFVLGRPNVVPFLGSEDEVTRRLYRYTSPGFDEVEQEHEYTPASSRAKMSGGLAGCSPLTAQQLSTVCGPATGAVIAFGTPAGGLRQLGSMGATADGRPWFRLMPAPGTRTSEDLLEALDTELAQRDLDAPPIVLLPPEWGWSWEWVTGVVEYLDQAEADHRRSARVVFVADPATTLRLVRAAPAEPSDSLGSLISRGVRCISLGPWRQSVLLERLAASGWTSSAGIDSRELSRLTGNWPLLLEHCMPDAGRPLASVADRMHELDSRLAAGLEGPLGAAFGLDLAAGKALQELVLQGGSPDIELDLRPLPASLEWAALLHLARSAGSGRWRLDPVVARLLQGARHTS